MKTYMKFFTDTNCQCAEYSDCDSIKDFTEELCKDYNRLNAIGRLDKKYKSIRHTHYNVVEFIDMDNNKSYTVISE